MFRRPCPGVGWAFIPSQPWLADHSLILDRACAFVFCGRRCPADQIVLLPNCHAYGAVAEWDPIDAAGFDNCCPVEVVQILGRPSGSFFPRGKTYNVWLVTEGNGDLFRACTQVIKVVPPLECLQNGV